MTGYEALFSIGWLGVVAVIYMVTVIVVSWLHDWASRRKTDRL